MEQVLFLMVVFLTNIIQVITGFAGTLLAMPSSMVLIGVNEAKTLLNVIGLLSCLFITIQNYKQINKKEFIKITTIMFVGMLIGIWMFGVVELKALLTFYAIMIIAIALKNLFVKKKMPIPKGFMVFIILAAGIIHGMFVSGGSLLVIYAVSRFADKTEFRATLSPVWVMLNTYLMFGHIAQGFFTPHIILLAALCIIPLIGGIYFGNIFHKKIKQSAFLKLTYILLLLSGILLLV